MQKRCHRLICRVSHTSDCPCDRFPPLSARRHKMAIKLYLSASKYKNHALHGIIPKKSYRSTRQIQPPSSTTRMCHSFVPFTTMLLNGLDAWQETHHGYVQFTLPYYMHISYFINITISDKLFLPFMSSTTLSFLPCSASLLTLVTLSSPSKSFSLPLLTPSGHFVQFPPCTISWFLFYYVPVCPIFVKLMAYDDFHFQIKNTLLLTTNKVAHLPTTYSLVIRNLLN